MPFALEYTLGSAEYLAQQLLVNPRVLRNYKNVHLRTSIFWLAVSVLGLVAAVDTKSASLTLVFLCIVIFQAMYTVAYYRQYSKTLASAIADLPTKQVCLLVDERGLHETVEDIESFAPWNAVKSYAILEENLFLELNAGLWSIIPLPALASLSGTAQTEFLELLHAKAIPQYASASVGRNN